VVKRGFILTPTYRVVAGRPEVHLHSILDDGKLQLWDSAGKTTLAFIKGS